MSEALDLYVTDSNSLTCNSVSVEPCYVEGCRCPGLRNVSFYSVVFEYCDSYIHHRW